MTNSWLHIVHEDGQSVYRWYVLNGYGELICSSSSSFKNEIDAKLDLSTFLVLMGRDTAA
jgi:hypothetical protein